MDGIDVALIRTDGKQRVERDAFGFYAYSHETRELLQRALVDAVDITQRDQRPGCLELAEKEITRLHIAAVKAFLSDNRLSPEEIDYLGFHGQTVLHRPEKALTVQLGDGALLSKDTGIATVFDMRANDMAHGGQGAPLIPVYHEALAKNVHGVTSIEGPICFVNIGGISNITFVGDELIAFDSGPGNALIDQWVQKHVGISHDQGGAIAAEGNVDRPLVDSYLSDPFFECDVPKSLDRNDFVLPSASNLGVETVARSLARVSAEAILKSADHLPEFPAVWIICGGGRYNPHIMQDLFELAAAKNAQVLTAEDAGFNGDAMEAEGWAYLAVRASAGLPLTFPKTTGCITPVSGGVISLPD